jgi:hypothetical protein
MQTSPLLFIQVIGDDDYKLKKGTVCPADDVEVDESPKGTANERSGCWV